MANTIFINLDLSRRSPFGMFSSSPGRATLPDAARFIGRVTSEGYTVSTTNLSTLRKPVSIRSQTSDNAETNSQPKNKYGSSYVKTRNIVRNNVTRDMDETESTERHATRHPLTLRAQQPRSF